MRIVSDRGCFAQGVTFSKGGLLIGYLCLMGAALEAWEVVCFLSGALVGGALLSKVTEG